MILLFIAIRGPIAHYSLRKASSLVLGKTGIKTTSMATTSKVALIKVFGLFDWAIVAI